MIGKVIIREYEVYDKEKVINLLKLNTPIYFAPEEEDDLFYYLDHEIEKYYVIELDGNVVGSGGINFKENNTVGCISWDLLHPDFQRRGLGTLILNYRIDKLKENEEIKEIIVRTSQLVYEYYEKAGFTLVEKVKDFWAPGYDLYKMNYTKHNSF